MIGDVEPELLVGTWLHQHLDGIKVWVDPRLPHDWTFTAPLIHLQRGAGFSAATLALDDAALDIDVYAAVAEHARDTARRIWVAMTLALPGTTFQPSGILVKHCSATTAPLWAPDPNVYRRAAAYRVVLHGFAPT